jgi:hypothetical protein
MKLEELISVGGLFGEDDFLSDRELGILLKLLLIEGTGKMGRDFLIEVVAFSLYSMDISPYMIQSFFESQGYESNKIKIYRD